MPSGYPRSFAAQYYRAHCLRKGTVKSSKGNAYGPSYDTILRILANADGKEGFNVPEPSSLVVHLRLGDMVEGSLDDPLAMLQRGGNPLNKKWPNSIKSAHELLENAAEANTSQVHLVGGGCWRRTNKKIKNTLRDVSCVKSHTYAHCLRAALQTKYNTTLSMDDNNADRDFYFMVRAKKFVEGVGGFSRIAADLVKLQGGHIVGRQFVDAQAPLSSNLLV